MPELKQTVTTNSALHMCYSPIKSIDHSKQLKREESLPLAVTCSLSWLGCAVLKLKWHSSVIIRLLTTWNFDAVKWGETLKLHYRLWFWKILVRLNIMFLHKRDYVTIQQSGYIFSFLNCSACGWSWFIILASRTVWLRITFAPIDFFGHFFGADFR